MLASPKRRWATMSTATFLTRTDALCSPKSSVSAYSRAAARRTSAKSCGLYCSACFPATRWRTSSGVTSSRLDSFLFECTVLTSFKCLKIIFKVKALDYEALKRKLLGDKLSHVRHTELYQRVHKDVWRTDRNHKFYAADANKNSHSLLNILMTYSLAHSSTCSMGEQSSLGNISSSFTYDKITFILLVLIMLRKITKIYRQKKFSKN